MIGNIRCAGESFASLSLTAAIAGYNFEGTGKNEAVLLGSIFPFCSLTEREGTIQLDQGSPLTAMYWFLLPSLTVSALL